jgi:AcrR family transcriptional regulator
MPMPARHRADALRPRKQPLQTRAQETVRAIVRAAAQVFSSRGYAASTTNHIAERAGVSIGSLYEYFPNKDALLIALMEEHILEGEAILAAAAIDAANTPGGLAAVVRQFVRAMVEFHARDRALHRVLFEETPLPARVRRRLTDLEEQVTARVHGYLRGQAGVRRRDLALAAAVVVQTVEGLTHKLVLYGERDAPVEPYIDEMVTLVTAYLTTPTL